MDARIHIIVGDSNNKSHPIFNELISEREVLKNELKDYGHIFDKSVISRELNKKESVEN